MSINDGYREMIASYDSAMDLYLTVNSHSFEYVVATVTNNVNSSLAAMILKVILKVILLNILQPL